jgi:hypothetical protein
MIFLGLLIKMNNLFKLFLITICLSFFCVCFAQESITYRVDAFGSVADGDFTPFWMTNNTYGLVPLKSNNAYLRSDWVWEHPLGKDFGLKAEADFATASNHTSSVWVQQLYADISYKAFHLTAGSREWYNSILDKELSSGDMLYSPNARPIPEININIPVFTVVPYTKEILKFKADFAAGKSFDNDYILRTKTADAKYATDILWHHKSLFLQLEDPEEKFPLVFTAGFGHGVQWGGWTSSIDFGKLPVSFQDFARIVLGKSGGSQAIEGDQINVLGNHQGTMNVKLGYKTHDFLLSLYKQHFFDDNSGMEYANWRDGIWGAEISLNNCKFIRKIVFEYIYTADQSGPFHFLIYDNDRIPKPRGGGNDDYYNHGYYFSGWSHFGRGIGNSLITSPEYNDDRFLGFRNNRIKSYHAGINGQFIPVISYRALFTQMYGWGTMDNPFLKRKSNFSSLIELMYEPQNLKGWSAGFQLAFDKGDLYGDNLGCSLKVSKTGILSF